MATATDDNAEIRNLDARLFKNQLVGTLVLCGNTKSRSQLCLTVSGISHFKRRSAGSCDPASMKKKKFYYK